MPATRKPSAQQPTVPAAEPAPTLCRPADPAAPNPDGGPQRDTDTGRPGRDDGPEPPGGDDDWIPV